MAHWYTHFVWADALLSSWQAPVVGGVAYLLGVFLLRHAVPAGGIKGLHGVFAGHNAILSLWSLVMFAGCSFEIIARWRQDGSIDWFFCEPPSTQARGPLYFWSYIFYISKYYEMLDTFLAILRDSRPPHFKLHIYHHSLVPLMIWNWLQHRQTLQFPGLLWNSFVHIVMYTYYFYKVMGWPTPWKKAVTRLQVVQFVSSVGFGAVTVAFYLGPDLLSSSCSGMRSMWLNLAFNITLLWQFVGVLVAPARNGKSHRKPVAENGHADHAKES